MVWVHVDVAHGTLLLLEGHLGEVGILMEETIHHLILGGVAAGAPEAAERGIRASANQSVMLETLVVADVLCELAERIARG